MRRLLHLSRIPGSPGAWGSGHLTAHAQCADRFPFLRRISEELREVCVGSPRWEGGRSALGPRWIGVNPSWREHTAEPRIHLFSAWHPGSSKTQEGPGSQNPHQEFTPTTQPLLTLKVYSPSQSTVNKDPSFNRFWRGLRSKLPEMKKKATVLIFHYDTLATQYWLLLC